MEQKTEASQAVDERQEYEAFQKWMSEKKAQPFADMEWEAWKDGRACLRAALKAQPAPTEAQGEESSRLDDLATIRDLDRLGMELGAKLAQMVGHLDNGVEYLPRDAIMIAVTDWRSVWSKNAKARKPINRARASAETGGVKP